MRPGRSLALLLVLATLPSTCATSWAVDPANTLVLYNPLSSEGVQIANHYKAVYPGVRTRAIFGLGSSETITSNVYLNTIRPQVLAALASSENANNQLIVTTKGMPLRIQVTDPNPGSYVDPQGIPRTILQWKPYSSLESELAAVDIISTGQMMGDQSYAWPGHFTKNPYYNADDEFSHDVYLTRLTARLDGYSVGDVTAAIDRAQNAFIGPFNSPAGPAHFIVDNDPGAPYDVTMQRLVDDVLGPAGMPPGAGNFDDTNAFISTANGPVIGYDSHGVHPYTATPVGYITDVLGSNLTLANGAVFTSLESFNAYSFNDGGYAGNQGQIAEWLEIGGTAAVGHVEEPIASWVTVTNEDIMFQALLDGRSFAEAAWLANFQLSYVNTLVGDPLMRWRMLTRGDVNRDGIVDISDLSIMGANWGSEIQPGGYGWTIGDVNSDGLVDISDLSLLGSNWGSVSSWATGGQDKMDLDGFAAGDLENAILPYIHNTPEPATWVLLTLGLAGLAAHRVLVRRARRGS